MPFASFFPDFHELNLKLVYIFEKMSFFGFTIFFSSPLKSSTNYGDFMIIKISKWSHGKNLYSTTSLLTYFSEIIELLQDKIGLDKAGLELVGH